MQEPKVTVVIPNYKGIRYIRGCMDSLRREREAGTKFHILVVDNASGDGSLEIVKEEYPEAQVIELSDNTGFCHAVNVGIRAAQTPFVILLNNDTEVKPGFVRALTEAVEKDEKIFSVSPMMLTMQDESLLDGAGDGYSILGWAYSRGKGRPATAYEQAKEIFSASAGASIYRKSIMEEIGYFDENHFAYLEDVDIGYRARIFGYRNFYEPGAKVIHAGSAASGSKYNAFKTRMSSANNAYMIGKNMPLLQLICNLPFLLVGFLVKACFFTCKKMGILYIRGYFNGIRRCFLKEGRKHRIPFRLKHSVNYLKVQIWLIFGVFENFIKY